MHKYLYLNGSILAGDAARISPFDHGFTVGDGVFESLITYGGKPFALHAHWQRLVQSAQAMELHPPNFGILQQAVHDLIQANELMHARIRVTLTAGEAPLGSEKSTHPASTLTIASMELPQRAKLAIVATSPWTRNERGALANIKSTSYAENVRALAAAQKVGAQEAIFPNTQGHVCEGTGSNIFLVHRGALHTPPLDSGCLAGITRATVLELCHQLRIEVNQSPLPMQALYEADEAFLTSTYREVQPILRADHHQFPNCPGPVTSKIQAAFQSHVTAFQNTDPQHPPVPA